MKTLIEIHLKNDANNKEDVYTVVLDNQELATLLKISGVKAANLALDKFVNKFTSQFKERLSAYLNS